MSAAEQILALELLVTHLQRDLESMHGVLLDHQQQINHLTRVLGLLDERMARLGPTEKFDPQAERPPHY